jgi:hypothetical protein
MADSVSNKRVPQELFGLRIVRIAEQQQANGNSTIQKQVQRTQEDKRTRAFRKASAIDQVELFLG